MLGTRNSGKGQSNQMIKREGHRCVWIAPDTSILGGNSALSRPSAVTKQLSKSHRKKQLRSSYVAMQLRERLPW
jgi:hypothetical protein